ncbi:alpha/beta hydrolase [Microbacterium sp.]|uniref:alpha/beta hydrolase n=1 Tax=Microbacterium sp. TaxID=51671 RepID=UPI002B9B87F9|nr:alpha/beta hydrolase [Microbacterium sp.]HWK77519.1 alpha/beta hydrolase [Microbacterium sp.]
MTFDAVFIHGAGRRGAAAWPGIGSDAGLFLSFEPGSSIAEQVDVLVAACSGRRPLLFAHSIGAVPAVLAATSGRIQVAALVLVEPALYDIVRGEPSIERHISAVTEARARATEGDLRGFWAILRPLMFGGPFDPDAWEMERPAAERWATTNVPWGHGVRRGMISGIPTLVVTGGWNDEYETIARALLEEGAEHRVIEGAQHRPQDLPGFAAIVAAFRQTTRVDAAR